MVGMNEAPNAGPTAPYDDDADLLSKVQRWDKEIEGHWGAWKREAREAYDFVAGRQWDKDDEAAMREARRAPVVFNRIAPIIDSVIGAEINGRQEVQYLPRQIEATGPNEVLSKGAEWIRDQCDAATEESDAFRDCLITGVGWTETRMDYEDEPQGKIIIERVDPLEVAVDPRARKPNFADARYLRWSKPYSREEFEDRWPDAQGSGAGDATNNPTVINDPKHRYEDDSIGDDDPDTVIVRQYQWYELEDAHVAEIAPGQVKAFSPAEHKAVQSKLSDVGLPPLNTVKSKVRRYHRAFISGAEVLSGPDPLPDGEFTLKAITGKRDRNEGVFYGLVRPMVDPQRWANKFFSQALHILNSNAKGGLLAEEGAFADARQAERSWAKADSITWVQPGGLARGAIQPKVAPPMPAAIPQLMDWSVAAIRDVSGVNEELLGMAGREQPGVLEAQRKESAYGILAAFFDSLRRYRKLQGRLLLKYINKYLPDGTLVRIVGQDGAAQYVPMTKDPNFDRFDVIVDDAPSGPNEKQKVFAMLMQFQGLLQEAGPEVLAELIKYSPLPDSLSQKLAQLITGQAQAQAQAAQAAQQPQPQAGPGGAPVDPQTAQVATGLALADKQADIASKNALAQFNLARAAKFHAEAQAAGAFDQLIPPQQ